jgi:hypothetical protein
MNFRPVFIGGCDRSGTTLLGDMLGSTSWSFATPETQFFHELLLRIKLGAFDSSEEAAAWLHGHFRFATWELDLDVKELAALINLEKPRVTVEAIVEHYLRQTHPQKTAADVWIDHTPDNFKYHPMLKALFPEARFIHIVRDGRAVSSSITPLDWGPNNAYSASRHWAERMEQALSVESAEGDNCFRLHFEQLVAEPHSTICELCDFIGIPFDPQMLNGGGLRLPAFTKKQHSLVGKAPQKDKAEAWRSKMTRKDLRDFESYPFSRLLLEKMGYPLEFTELPELSRLRIFNRYLHEFFHYMKNRIRHRRMEHGVVSSYQQQCDEGLSERNTTPPHGSGTRLFEPYKS